MDNEQNFSSNDKGAAERERPVLFLEMTDIDGRRYHCTLRPDGSLGRWLLDETTPRIKPRLNITY